MYIKSWERVFICGLTQSGKTTLAIHLIKSLSRFVIYDIKGQYRHLGTVVNDPHGFLLALKNNTDKIVIHPTDPCEEDFNKIAGYVWKYLKNSIFIVDEAHLFAPNNGMSKEFKQVITVMEGEDHRVGVWCITQRPQNIDKTITGQATHTISFMMPGFLEAQAVRNIPVKTLQELKRYWFAHKSVDSIEISIYPPIRM